MFYMMKSVIFFVRLETIQEHHLLVNINIPSPSLPHSLLLMNFFFIHHQCLTLLSKFTLLKETGKIASLEKYRRAHANLQTLAQRQCSKEERLY